MSRAEDRSFWARSAYYAEKYKILVWFVGLMALALGFDFKLPGQVMHGMQVQIDSLKRQIVRIDSVDTKVDALLRLRCIDRKPEDEGKYLAARINCEQILSR